MEIVITGIKLILWLVIIPYCCGIPVAKHFGKEGRYLEMTFVAGYLLMIAWFQLVYLGFVLFYNHFTPLVWCTGVLFMATAIIALRNQGGHHLGGRKSGRQKKTRGEVVLWGIFFVLLSLQLYMTIFYSYPDGDDAFYAVTSVITETNDNMYINIPYTGETSILDKRHAFSSAPVFIAFLARVCGVHPIIMSNIFFSIIVICLTYMIYKMIAVRLFSDQQEYVPVFLILISMFYLFGNSTIYQSTTFLLTRTGQGKAFLANIIPTATILALLYLDKEIKESENDSDYGAWILLSLIMLAAGYTSTMGMFLGPFLAGGGVVLLSVRYRKPILLKYFAVAAFPLIVTGSLYLFKVY